jgi:hypothetical protein
MTYYKFLRLKDGQVISDWDESVWERNEWRDIAIAPVLQAQGFYAAERIADAVPWFGNVLAEVEVRGLTVPAGALAVTYPPLAALGVHPKAPSQRGI